MTYAPMIGSVADFVALLSVPSDVDVAALAATIESGADPNKWICVSADAVDVLVNGNVILFSETHLLKQASHIRIFFNGKTTSSNAVQ